MNKNIPFQTIDLKSIPKTEYKGERGTAYWQTEFAKAAVLLVMLSDISRFPGSDDTGKLSMAAMDAGFCFNCL
jgi:hypothetical protein